MKKKKEINRYRLIALNSLLKSENVENTKCVEEEVATSSEISVEHKQAKVFPFKVIRNKQSKISNETPVAVGNEITQMLSSTETSDSKKVQDKSLKEIPKQSIPKRQPGDIFIGAIKGVGKSVKWAVDTIFRILNIIVNTVLSLLDSAIWIVVSLIVIVGGNAILFQLGYIEFDMIGWLTGTAFDWVKEKWNSFRNN